MAVIKKKGNKSLPPISTASLPDVIFMILFFFGCIYHCHGYVGG